ncbi:hypothetical protein M3Y94_01037000 [Aphelenchoides besseyi]|nr:hypothetical protein M3Y94_01037000 [Aphelenchoides besseyi]
MRKSASWMLLASFVVAKSFLLTCFIRYLEWLEAGSPPDVDWINIPCDGFKARGGFKRETLGIDVWPKSFTVKKPNGSKLKILLVDTQGLFDNQTDMQSCGAIFGIAALLSSVMIYNTSRCIGSDDLGNLALFVDFATEVSGRNGNTPLQKLVFLVRDCTLSKEFGFEVGAEYLASLREQANSEVADVWSLLDRASEEVVGCCLPSPNGSGIFDGNVAEMGDEFGRELRSFIEQLVDKLVPNKMNGQEMTCLQFAAQLQSFPEVFKDGSLPEVDDVYQANVKMQLENVCRNIIGHLYNAVETEADGREDFRSCYETHEKEAIAQFEEQSATIGEPQHRQMAAQKLCEEMDKVYDRFNKENKTIIQLKKSEREQENIWNEIRTREEAHQRQMNQLREEMQNAKNEAEHQRLQEQEERKQRDRERERQFDEQRKKEMNEMRKQLELQRLNSSKEICALRETLENQRYTRCSIM